MIVHNNTVLRTPLLAYNNVFSLIQNEQTLKQAYQNPIFQEALYIASPDLFEQLQQWLNGKHFEEKTHQKLINALMRYLLRMAFRPTPFGMFAGVSSLAQTEYEQETTTEGILLTESKEYKKHLRLDMQVTGALIEKILQNKVVRNQLKFYPNSSLYRLGNQYRYFEYRYEKKFRKYQVSGIAYDELITLILQYAQSGITIQALAEQLAPAESDKEQFQNYIEQLVDAQILVSELELSVTGEDAGERLLKRLQKIPAASEYVSLLNNVLSQVQRIIESKVGFPVSEYQKIIEIIQQSDVPYETSKLFQVVLHKPVQSANLPQRFSKNILEAISLLQKINSKQDKTILDTFCEKYHERYEEQEMPLSEVLDNETGIGFPPEQYSSSIAPLVDDIPVLRNSINQTIEWSTSDNFLFAEFQQALKNNSYQIVLDEKKLNKLETTDAKLPPTFSAMTSIVFENEKEYVFLQSAGGSSANQLVGRFCYADENIEQLCKDVAAHEQEVFGDAIRAEIVHITESRLGNILQRPVLSQYEIPYMAQSVLPTEFQIPISDLIISVRNNQVLLRSKRLNKRVIPVLSSAHNFSSNSLTVYHFLCSLQLQNIQSFVSFSWGAIRDKAEFLPRVTYKDVILSPATWQFRKKRYKNVVDAKTEEDLLVLINQFRTENNMPRFVSIADGDNELVLDLENALCLKVLKEELKKRNTVTLVESFINLQKSFVKCVNDFFTHQLVFSFKNTNAQLAPYEFKDSSHVNIKRTFLPSEEWVYYKIYCGSSSSNSIISQIIFPVTRLLMKQNIIDEWFFIRYADPKNHIRVRFKLLGEKNVNDITARLKFYLKQFLSYGVVSDVSINTYNRELERYKFSNIQQAEKLFFFDSEFCLSVMQQNISAEDLWKVALWNTYILLEDFGFTDKQKIEIAMGIKNSLSVEHNLSQNKAARETINSKYRTYQKSVIAVVKGEDTLINSLIPFFSRRSDSNKQSINEIRVSVSENDIHDFAGSIIHMSLNRLFTSKQRLQELVTYDFLQRGLVTISKTA